MSCHCQLLGQARDIVLLLLGQARDDVSLLLGQARDIGIARHSMLEGMKSSQAGDTLLPFSIVYNLFSFLCPQHRIRVSVPTTFNC